MLREIFWKAEAFDGIERRDETRSVSNWNPSLQCKRRNSAEVPDDAAHRTKNTSTIKTGMQCTRDLGSDFEALRVGEYVESISIKSLLDRGREGGLTWCTPLDRRASHSSEFSIIIGAHDARARVVHRGGPLNKP